jgi:hypothetical protein
MLKKYNFVILASLIFACGCNSTPASEAKNELEDKGLAVKSGAIVPTPEITLFEHSNFNVSDDPNVKWKGKYVILTKSVDSLGNATWTTRDGTKGTGDFRDLTSSLKVKAIKGLRVEFFDQENGQGNAITYPGHLPTDESWIKKHKRTNGPDWDNCIRSVKIYIDGNEIR